MRILRLFLALIICSNLSAQLNGVFDYRIYPTSDNTRYAEFYYTFNPKSIVADSIDNNHVQYNVEVTLFLKDSSNKILNYDKALFKSPVFENGKATEFSFSNRLKVSQQLSQIEVIFKDPNNPVEQKIEIPPSKTDINISAKPFVSQPLVIVSANSNALISKGGRYFNINHEKVFDNQTDIIEFYSEIYIPFTNADNKYASRFVVINSNGQVVLQRILKFNESKDPTVTIASFPLDNLDKGNYNLGVYLYGSTMIALDSAFTDFTIRDTRNNVSNNINIKDLILNESFISDINNFDSLNYLIGSLAPIAEDFEETRINNRNKSFASVEDQKLYFYNFWEKRNPDKPDQAWSDYYAKVKQVNAAYGTPIKEGYESDRGRIYLKYGEPNTISERPNEPDSYPYEIWHYYKISLYNNVKFVFYSPDEVTNDYQLLHSDMPQELRNPQWQVVLRNRSNTNPDFLNRDPGSSFGSRSEDLFNNPR